MPLFLPMQIVGFLIHWLIYHLKLNKQAFNLISTKLLYSKTGVCRGIPIFLIFAPKHRLWVLVRVQFHWKIFDIFLIFAQNIDCGYTLELPRNKNKKNRYTPPYPNFTNTI